MSLSEVPDGTLRQVGDVLQGRYRIDGWLGSGGMGGVYQATHQGLDAAVAIKELTLRRHDPDEELAAIRQFHREASILHGLHHRNLPRVNDIFEEAGVWYLVMDFIDGQTLGHVARLDRVTATQVRGWADQLCQVLHYLHTHDPPVIFRDLKPANVMLTEDGVIKLIDFGIAKSFNVNGGCQTETSVRGAGTPGFAAPEQYGSGTDVRTDIYSLGATLYCLLSGRTPPESTAIAAGLAHVVPLLELRPDMSAEIAGIIDQMMNIRRQLRPASVQEVAAALGFSRGSYRISPPTVRRVVSAATPRTELRLTPGKAIPVGPETAPVRMTVRRVAPPHELPLPTAARRWAVGWMLALGLGALAMGAVGYHSSASSAAPVPTVGHQRSR